MAIREYAQLTRAHTAPLEAVPAVTGALLATGGSITPQVVGWGAFGVMYHLTGYSMNSYTDWRSGHDREDPNKTHHPLNTGAVTGSEARTFTLRVGLATAGLATYLSLPSMFALSLLVAMVFFGSIYNILGKYTELKFIPISIAHTLVFVLPYVALGGEMNILFYLVTTYIFLWIVFQISVSGELKDFTTDEANFLKSIRSGWLWSIGATGVIYSIAVKGSSLWLIIQISKEAGYYLPTLVIAVVCITFTTLMLATPKIEDERDSIIQTMSMIEGMMLFAMLTALAHEIGPVVALALGINSVAWVVAFNYIEWGTILAPRV